MIELATDFCKLEFVTTQRHFYKRLAWYKATEDHIMYYYQTHLRTMLEDVNPPYCSLLCSDVSCTDPEHVRALNSYANDLTKACIEASYQHIPCAVNRASSGQLPRWNSYVEPLRDKSLFWHHIWVDCGRPRSGYVADIMRNTRAAYHRVVRRKIKLAIR